MWKIRELNLLSFSWKKMSFSLKLLSGHFHGQFFIKTVRGPLKACMYCVCNFIKFKESVLNHFQI